MLKSINHLLNADVLHALRAMGHGDRIVVCDTNFPAFAVARETVVGRLLHMDNTTAPEAVEAILSVLPLDTFIDDPAQRMQVVGQPDEIPAVQQQVQEVVNAAEDRDCQLVAVERFAFYDAARSAFAVVQTGERRFYGCFIFSKGVIPPT